MRALALVLFALFGLVFGSFLTVLIDRTPGQESVVWGRSRCPSCGAMIATRDNIPLVSYVLLRGRCRSCRGSISAQYPIVEAVSAAAFVGSALAFGAGVRAGLVAPFLGVLLACSLIDLRLRIIPNRIVFPALAVFAAAITILWALLGGLNPLTALLGLLAYGGGLCAVALISPSGMGMGDAKLAALIGLVLGALGLRYVLVAAMAGVLAGGLGGIAGLLAGRSRKDTIPFGPYMATGAAVAAFLGPAISTWYGGLLR